jgi:hypothetical protein
MRCCDFLTIIFALFYTSFLNTKVGGELKISPAYTHKKELSSLALVYAKPVLWLIDY